MGKPSEKIQGISEGVTGPWGSVRQPGPEPGLLSSTVPNTLVHPKSPRSTARGPRNAEQTPRGITLHDHMDFEVPRLCPGCSDAPAPPSLSQGYLSLLAWAPPREGGGGGARSFEEGGREQTPARSLRRGRLGLSQSCPFMLPPTPHLAQCGQWHRRDTQPHVPKQPGGRHCWTSSQAALWSKVPRAGQGPVPTPTGGGMPLLFQRRECPQPWVSSKGPQTGITKMLRGESYPLQIRRLNPDPQHFRM